MAVVQDTYLTQPVFGYPGMVANGETSNRISRTVDTAAGIAFGKAAYRSGDHNVEAAQGTLTGAGSEAAGNVGTSTITDAPAVAAGTKLGRWTFVQTTTSATSLVLAYDPDGVLAGDGVVGTQFTIGGITATITSGGTATAGDAFYVDVTGREFMGFTIADHGIQVVPGGVAADIYPQYSTAAIMTMGVIWVTAGSATTDGAQVYITSAGAITTTAGSNIAAPGWFFQDTVADGAVVRIAKR